jgi:N-acetylglutamate synthase-like GNAT family acetyltransferase
MIAATENRGPELCLRGGLRVSLRPASIDDEPAILRFLTQLSAESRRRRFFTAAVDLRAETHRELTVPAVDHHGLLAWLPGRGVVGHAIYVRMPLATRAEVAVEVADDLHHLGLATQLVIRLAQDAEERHITRFFADVLPENGDMLAVFRDAFATVSVNGLDAIEIEFPTSGWRAADARFQSAR